MSTAAPIVGPMAHVDEDVIMEIDDHAVVNDLRDARRRNRLARLDWFEAFYKAYVAAIVSALVIYTVGGVTGDAQVTGQDLLTLRDHGASWLGIIASIAVAVGLRSGGRGGPLAMEQADVRHLVLAPVDRRVTLRRLATRNLRHAAFVGGGLGGAAGLLAWRQLPGVEAGWVAAGAIAGGTLAMFASAVALTMSGLRVPRWIADVAALLVVVWTAGDIYWDLTTTPATWIGGIALLPVHHPTSVYVFGSAGLVVVVVFAVVGWLCSPGISIEAAERRARLVSHLRFAATTQDLRTVMVLQRQLAQQFPRVRPWVRLPKMRRLGLRRSRSRTDPVETVTGPRRPMAKIELAATASNRPAVLTSVILRRSLYGLLRWPLARIVRLVLLVVVAVTCVWAAWTTAALLIVVSGLALWLAAIDLLESLAQESDHPDRLGGAPVVSGWVRFRHLYVPYVVLTALVAIVSLPLIIFGPDAPVQALVLEVLIAPMLAIGGATFVITQRATFSATNPLMPEAAGVQFLWRLLMPPTMAVGGVLPVVIARNAWMHHHTYEAMSAAMNLPMSAVLAAGTWAWVWVRHGQQLHDTLTTMGARSVGGPDAKVPK